MPLSQYGNNTKTPNNTNTNNNTTTDDKTLERIKWWSVALCKSRFLSPNNNGSSYDNAIRKRNSPQDKTSN